MEKIRSFIAVDIPASLRVRIGRLQDELRETRADVSWTRPEGIHLTLKFLGSITIDELDKIGSALAQVADKREPFEIAVQSAGCFPSLRNPRVLWVGIKGGTADIVSLQNAVEQEAAAAGFSPEARVFTPHLTLGRVRSSRSKAALIEAMEKNKDADFEGFQVREVCLFRSDLRPSGAVYTKLKIFPLTGGKRA
jgi:2'-5' RNA ligase